MQQGQVFELKKRAVDGRPVWAYRYRTDGPGSRRLQRGGFSSERDAAEALERALEHLRRQKGVGSTLTLRELVEEYLAQYDAEPETIDKLCWLLAKALCAFGGRRLPELRSQEIAAWRMRSHPGTVSRQPRRCGRCWHAQSSGERSTPTRPSKESTTRSVGA